MKEKERGRLVKERRIDAGIKQLRLAMAKELEGSGVGRSALSLWENGAYHLRPEQITAIETALERLISEDKKRLDELSKKKPVGTVASPQPAA